MIQALFFFQTYRMLMFVINLPKFHIYCKLIVFVFVKNSFFSDNLQTSDMVNMEFIILFNKILKNHPCNVNIYFLKNPLDKIV